MNRRIGENELSAIQASLAYVDAQREYYWWNPEGAPLLHYARSLVSTANRKDGLYWDAGEGETPSPLGALFASARAEGYLVDSAVRPVPYYGYHFRMLTAQGEHAAGGAYDYIVGDRMIGGFGLLAYPAEHGSTGVMTFIVNHDGVVFSKDLGADTAKLAAEIALFDPDESWKREESSRPVCRQPRGAGTASTGQRNAAQHSLRRAAAQRVEHAVAALRRHDDEVSSDELGGCHDLVDGIAVAMHARERPLRPVLGTHARHFRLVADVQQSDRDLVLAHHFGRAARELDRGARIRRRDPRESARLRA